MDVQCLSVGPIVGHTSPQYVRIFGRAEFSIDGGRPRKAHGVVRYRKLGSRNYSKPMYFKMNPNFDMTGVIVISGLDENTKYQYQVGWFYSDVDTVDINVDKVLEWKKIEVAEFKTASSSQAEPRSLVFGSCRYVLRLFGGLWWDDRGDKVFKSILEQVKTGETIDQLIMCGDQIYADDLNELGADECIDEYNKRYQKILTTPYLRKLMSQVPTYMMLDDHEIEDNWPESADSRDWVKKFPAAIQSFATYQSSHSPLFDLNGSRISGTPTHLWYQYTDGCCEFFVTDCRTERNLNSNSLEMIGPRQKHELLQWLTNGSGMVKVIVTSIPLYESESSDKWHGFINQRDEILECIRTNSVSKVVFLSGDVHACMASQLDLGNGVKITSIVSSAFFWPYPHPNRRDFKLSGNIKTSTTNSYKVINASDVYPKDAFTKLDVSVDKLGIKFICRKGLKLGSLNFDF